MGLNSQKFRIINSRGYTKPLICHVEYAILAACNRWVNRLSCGSEYEQPKESRSSEADGGKAI